MTKKMNASRTAGALAGLLVVVSTSIACSNMLSGSEVNQSISEQVNEANAEEVTITMAATGGGTVSPAGAGISEKVGIAFNLTAKAETDYYFTGWTYAGDGTVTFASATSETTTATITKAAASASIVITGNFVERPKYQSSLPSANEKDVFITSPIIITFNKDIDPSTATLSNITVKRKIGIYGTDTDITSIFENPTVSGAVVTLSLKSGQSLGDNSANYIITVSLSKSIAAMDKSTMASSDSFSFTTSKSGDTENPSIGAITVKNSAGVALPSGNPTNSTSVIVDFDASDNSGTNLNATIADNLGNTLYNGAYKNNIAVTLHPVNSVENQTLTVTVKDLSGNPATATAAVAYDTVAPSVSSVSFNPSSGWRKAGDPIVMTINASEGGLSAGTITVNGKATTGFADKGGGAYEATYTVEAADDQIAQNATIPVSVTLSDPAGNASNTVTTSPGYESCPGIDTAAPTFTTNYAPASGTLKIDSTLTYTLTSTESGLAAGTLSINGKTQTLSASGSTYTVTYKVASGDDDRARGAIPVTLTLKDAAGNESAAYATNPANVGVDAHAPVAPGALTKSKDYLNVATTSLSVRVPLTGTGATADDTLSLKLGTGTLYNAYDLTSTDISNGYHDFTVTGDDFGSDGTKSITAWVTDAAGNAGEESAALSLTKDTSAPAIAFSSPAANAAVNGTQAIALTGASGTTVEARIGTGTWEALDLASDTIADLTDFAGLGQGEFTVGVRATDGAGNTCDEVTIKFIKDTAPPEAAGTPSKSPEYINYAESTGTVTVGVEIAAGAVAGDVVEVLYNGASFSTPQTHPIVAAEIGKTISIPLDGTLFTGTNHVLTTKVSDAAGSESAESSGLTLTKDVVAPTVTSVTLAAASGDRGPGGANYTKVTSVVLTFAGASSDLAQYQVDSGSVGIATPSAGTWIDYSESFDVTLVDTSQGDKTIKLRLKDTAGNVTEACAETTDTVTYDSEEPSITTSSVSRGESGSNATLAIGTILDATGVVRILAGTGDGTAAPPATPYFTIAVATSSIPATTLSGIGKNAAFVFQLVDQAGNVGGGAGTGNYIYVPATGSAEEKSLGATAKKYATVKSSGSAGALPSLVSYGAAPRWSDAGLGVSSGAAKALDASAAAAALKHAQAPSAAAPAVNASLSSEDVGMSLLATRRGAAKATARAVGGASRAEAASGTADDAAASPAAPADGGGDARDGYTADFVAHNVNAATATATATQASLAVLCSAPAGSAPGPAAPPAPDTAAPTAPRQPIAVAPASGGWKRRMGLARLD